MKRVILLLAAGAAFGGCVSLRSSSPYVGRPVVDAVRELGPPDSIADYHSGERHFGWSTSDVSVHYGEPDNPANWLEPRTRTNALADLDAEKLTALPDYIVTPDFRPPPCSLTLVAEWDTRASAWIARRAIRRGAGPGGRCGMREAVE